MSNKLYFKSIDDNHCYSLEQHFLEAAEEELEQITLIEAIPDDGTEGYVWCTYYGEVTERSECKKAYCPKYESKSGRGVCSNRGSLYWHGEKVKFDVPRINKQIGE